MTPQDMMGMKQKEPMEITISIDESGQITVSSSTGASGGEMQDEQAEAQGTPAKDWKDALRIVQVIYNNGGSMQDNSDEQAGFNSVMSQEGM